ncbi:serine/threonine protein kinase [Dokdonella fugitiva]|uniref:serine/threonine protein kinase n=1 Tax=Dokdonella fugitiva TaxID=328517 RepID=UPI0015F9D973|nr:serine/threonine protein kinase [Dokdonella fugitiva]MBA8882924.1 Ser/Thr protein kinase RdoA (MazF antagonist) [Dokdonella fugitiva]
MTAAAPYDALTPDTVLDAIEAAGYAADGRLLALPSYENRVYQVGIEDGAPLVAKFYRPARWSDAAIAEEHAFALELAAAELPVVAPLVVDGATLLVHAAFRYTLYPRRGGRAPELESADHLAWMGRLLARLHAVGARSRFRVRGAIDGDGFVREAARAVLASPLLPRHLEERYRARTVAIADLVDARFASVAPATLRLHGDCHGGNVLWTDAGPHFVDLDDARTGPAVQDLWMLAPSPRALDALLEGYAEFRDFDPRELDLVEPLRLMRQIHWAGWVAARWHDPAFPRGFPQVGEERWWEQHLADLAEAAERLQDG